MNPGVIWWHQLGNSIRLVETIADTLMDCRSAVLRVPQNLPWRQDFYEAIDTRRASFSGERRLMRLQWEENSEPGAYVLDELCSSRVRAEYWPGQTHAQYLASKDDILLNEYYVWIAGIHRKSDICKWVDFVSQYVKHSELPDQRAVFILEYDGEDTDVLGVEKTVYSVENYDCRVFALETTSDLANSDLRDFQAELALCVSGGNPELCYELLAAGDRFLKNPVQTVSEVSTTQCSSAGKPYDTISEQQVQSAAWEASIVLLFPILERYRMDFVQNNAAELKRHLPISNSNGDRIVDPFDLEIGGLCYITSNDTRHFSEIDIDTLRLCRKVRNLLAHNKAPSYSDVVNILKLQ